MKNNNIKENIEYFINSLECQSFAESTLKSYRGTLNRLYEYTKINGIHDINKITHYEIEGFLEWCSINHNINYSKIYKTFIFLTKFFRKLKTDNIISLVPTSQIVIKKNRWEPDYLNLTSLEYNKLIDVAMDQKSKLRAIVDSTFIIFLGETGCRRSDAISRRWEHIDFDERKIILYINKMGEDVYVKMSDELYDALYTLYRYCNPGYYDAIFLSNKNKQISTSTMHTYFRKIIDKSNIEKERIAKIDRSKYSFDEYLEELEKIKISFHSFRRKFITERFIEGKTVEEIMILTGHNDKDTLIKYRSRMHDDFDSIVDAINNEMEG